MNVCWVISEEALDDQVLPEELKTIGEAWGSWRIWKSHKPDNCVCSSIPEAENLVGRLFHTITTLYISTAANQLLDKPPGVKLFGGTFHNSSISNKDDIITLNLASTKADIILMYGFNFSPLLNTDEEEYRKSREEYYFNVRELIKNNPDTQYVLIDYYNESAEWIGDLENLTFDVIDSVRNLLT
jgi:hypothetical protein